MDNKQKKADFQDEYRQSSNFGKNPADDELKIKGDGDLKAQNDEEMEKKEDKETIEDTLRKISSEEE